MLPATPSGGTDKPAARPCAPRKPVCHPPLLSHRQPAPLPVSNPASALYRTWTHRHRQRKDSQRSPDPMASRCPCQVSQPPARYSPRNLASRHCPAPNLPALQNVYATAPQFSVPENESPPNRRPAPLKPAPPPRKHAPNCGPAPAAGPLLRPDQNALGSRARIPPPDYPHPAPNNAPPIV